MGVCVAVGIGVDVVVCVGARVGVEVKVWVGGTVGDDGDEAMLTPVQAERMMDITHPVLINFILFIST